MIISILGCGWLGFPLAKRLITKGHSVKGSTTSPEKLEALAESHIEPYQINLNPEIQQPEKLQFFFEADVLVLNIPPGRRRKDVVDFHYRQIQSVDNILGSSPVSFVVFVSSTSVYPSNPGQVIEMDAIPGKAGRDSGNALLKVEELLLANKSFDTTIVRFGGLIGGKRHPGNYLAGKKDLRRGDAPINLIHRDDCIAILTQVIEDQVTSEIFNAVANEHPTRKEYYTQAAKKLGLQPPQFAPPKEALNHKIVLNGHLKAKLGYTFKYPDPMEMI